MKWQTVPQTWTSSSEDSIAQTCAGSWNIAGGNVGQLKSQVANHQPIVTIKPPNKTSKPTRYVNMCTAHESK